MAEKKTYRLYEAFQADPGWARRSTFWNWVLLVILDILICLGIRALYGSPSKIGGGLAVGFTIWLFLKGISFALRSRHSFLFLTMDSLLIVRHLNLHCEISLKETQLPLCLHENEYDWLLNSTDGKDVLLSKKAYPSLPKQLEEALRRVRENPDLPYQEANL